MAENEETPGAAVDDEIKPYKIHVSSKYLKLTKQKLELTRLPHEGADPPSEDWWEPKPQVESLVDFWLEKYSWRDQEEILNKTPQFRTAISISGSEAPLRLHFVHVKSPHEHALPLLVIPPFPFSNLALLHLVRLFTEPEDAATNQPFHLVMPALPGLGFSDPLPTNTPEISTTAEMLNTVMARLGYQHYLATNAGPAQHSPAEIDWKLISHLSTQYPGSCIGAHFIAPSLAKPKLSEAPIEWAKWTIASAFSAGILGYSEQDFSALKSTPGAQSPRKKKDLMPSKLGLNAVGLREPNTLAYAMCDSPVGLLAFAMKGLGHQAPQMQFTPEQIITFANLAWLPGPEYSMRFWARCAAQNRDKMQEKKTTVNNKPQVGITVFLGGEDDDGMDDATTSQEVGQGAIKLGSPTKVTPGAAYACPAWGNTHYNVLFSQRVSGKAGLLAWERPDVILAGIRGLAAEVLKVDKRLQPEHATPTAPLEDVVVAQESATKDDGGLKPPPRPTLEQGESSKTQVAEEPATQDDGLKPPPRPVLEQGDSSQTQVASEPPASPKGKLPEAKPDDAVKPNWDNRDETDSPRRGTPDTIVMVTAPTGEETRE
ncbi:alpha/beta-hydrolase [Cryphonectria parasitica EP155]|uniref:Alpha/beta-hydrolase n=1 Tax=Cryphonectria parasitica (strain ATCC 38755 / EP155) TaxID=660469 RepID=A0A9P5CUI2_CRYP1|nr:alpha/beta-hydrolase [Cryphonectria parasitica EP155]KAF3770687.1 alpha/beta-hydrolase [Cryphonectria parasitica EP155]